ncbi:MAG: DUF1697 domain-containing protein [Mobilitalea sp.]
MTIYIALLRGINVGGKNIIKMANLKRSLESVGFNQVQTYIQSGNILFLSNEDEEVIKNRIEQKIKEDFDLSIPVILRTSTELEWIINNCPFSFDKITEVESKSEVECLYVSLLSKPPTQDKIEKLSTYSNENDLFLIEGREVFLLFSNGVRNSKLANNLQKLDVTSTVRNWKTINKLVILAKEMDTNL